MYTFALAALAVVILTGFQDGRKALQRVVWFLDGLLGGAPHIVTLPSPPGLPLIGNLIQVSCCEDLVLLHLTVASSWKTAISKRSPNGPGNMVMCSVFPLVNERQYVRAA